MPGELNIWPDWKLMELLDSGSSGVVYRAVHREHPELQAAVKIITIPADDEEASSVRGSSGEPPDLRYRQAAEACAANIRRLALFRGTSGIVSLEDFRILPREGKPGYLVCVRMELLKSLGRYLSDKKPEESDILQIGTDLCAALKLCHREGILHRDIKPENIFVNDRLSTGPLFKLGDFGCTADLDAPGAEVDLSGTPMYMAPEVANGSGKASVQSDLYSLGLTLYRLANNDRLPFLPPGKPFYRPEDKNIALQVRLSGLPLPPPEGASEGLAAILRKACAFDPAQRYASAADFRSDLAALQRKHQREDSLRKTRNFIRRPVFLVPVTLLCCLLLAAAFGILLSRGGRPFPGESPTALPLLPAATEVPRDLMAVESELLLDRLRGLGILSGGGVAYRVPLSVRALSPLAFLRGAMPEILADASASPPALRMSDGSAYWKVLLQPEGGENVPFLYREAESRYISSLPAARLPAKGSWLLSRDSCGSPGCSVDAYYSSLSAGPDEIHWEFNCPDNTGRVTWLLFPEKREGTPCALLLFSGGRPILKAYYDASGALSEVSYADRTYPVCGTADDPASLPMIEGVEWIP